MHGHVLFVFVGLQCQQNATPSLVNFVSGDPRPHQYFSLVSVSETPTCRSSKKFKLNMKSSTLYQTTTNENY